MNNVLQKLKPQKILGKGSEGIALKTHDSKYTVKIYRKPYLTAIIFLKIVNYLQDCKNLPKTIYKSYLFTSAINSFNRYISDNSLPNHFSYKDNNDLNELSSKYKMDKKLFEIMKTYQITFRTFLTKLESLDNKTIILTSLFQQGLLTLVWLYMEKGIVHNDLSYDNFFIQKTKKSFIKIGKYNVNLFGYYIVLGDFGYAKSMEFVDYKNYPEKIASIVRNELNPMININEFINIFLQVGLEVSIQEFENIKLNSLYKDLIKMYITKDENFEIKLNEFKNEFYNFIEKTYFINTVI